MFVLDVLVLREAMAYCSELMATVTDDTSVCNVARRSATNTSGGCVTDTETHYQVQHEMANMRQRSSKKSKYNAQGSFSTSHVISVHELTLKIGRQASP